MFSKFFRESKGHVKSISANTSRLRGPVFTTVRANYSSISSGASSLICVGGPSMQASLLHAVKNHKISKSQNVILIGGRSWLSKVHPDWYDKPWGQDMRYLPEPMAEIIKDLYRHYPENKIMNFGMMKHAVFELETRLQETGITLISKEVYDFQEENNGIYANFKDGSRLCLGDSHYKVLNAAIHPRALPNLPANHSGSLYHVPKKDSSDTVVFLGSGTNLTWCCRDFKKLRKIIHLKPSFDRPRNDLSDILHNNIALDEETDIQQSNGLITIYGTDLLSKERTVITVSDEMIFSALGHQHNSEITIGLDSTKVIPVNCGPSSNDLVKYHIVNSGKTFSDALDYRGTVVPPGNLKYNYLKINSKAGQFSTSTKNGLIVYEEWKDALLESAIAHDIEINPSFFEYLQPLAKHIYTSQVHEHEKVQKVIRMQYVKSGMPAKFIDGSQLNADQFMRLVDGTLSESLYDTHDLRRQYTSEIGGTSKIEELFEERDNNNETTEEEPKDNKFEP